MELAMKLFFLRHAQAEDGDTDDFHRKLTERGARRTATAAQVMRSLNIRPARIFSSPRVRAYQTAEIVANQLKMKVEIREEVGFGFDIQAVGDLIADLNPANEIMFVGHEPSMSMAVQGLTGASVAMKKGGLARVDLFDYAVLEGTLIWLIAPKVFDVLGTG
jgi:phosphohistidine phosphatase